jgi:hypothetical protein
MTIWHLQIGLRVSQNFMCKNPAWKCSLLHMGRINKQINELNEMKSKQAII